VVGACDKNGPHKGGWINYFPSKMKSRNVQMEMEEDVENDLQELKVKKLKYRANNSED
jgi:hypothetical protein